MRMVQTMMPIVVKPTIPFNTSKKDNNTLSLPKKTTIPYHLQKRQQYLITSEDWCGGGIESKHLVVNLEKEGTLSSLSLSFNHCYKSLSVISSPL